MGSVIFMVWGISKQENQEKKFKNLFLLRRTHFENFQPRGRTKKKIVINYRFSVLKMTAKITRTD